MLTDLASGNRIAREVERLLAEADARGRLPTPVEDIVAAAGLQRGGDEVFDEATLARAPSELRAAIKGLAGKVRAMLDRREREVYVHPEIQLAGRVNFQTLHEVAHDILPWQSALAYADDDLRLSWSTRISFEQEANQTAAELLFQRGLFTRMAADYAIGFAGVIELSEQIGASIHAAARRYAETHRAAVCALVLDSKPVREEPLAYGAARQSIRRRGRSDSRHPPAGRRSLAGRNTASWLSPGAHSSCPRSQEAGHIRT
ncbi:MAG: hypothetical protein M3R70_03990 [Actinomycetota bacterium]|nr:hypothetical protein [Actinomycetota bacterium]